MWFWPFCYLITGVFSINVSLCKLLASTSYFLRMQYICMHIVPRQDLFSSSLCCFLFLRIFLVDTRIIIPLLLSQLLFLYAIETAPTFWYIAEWLRHVATYTADQIFYFTWRLRWSGFIASVFAVHFVYLLYILSCNCFNSRCVFPISFTVNNTEKKWVSSPVVALSFECSLCPGCWVSNEPLVLPMKKDFILVLVPFCLPEFLPVLV